MGSTPDTADLGIESDTVPIAVLVGHREDIPEPGECRSDLVPVTERRPSTTLRPTNTGGRLLCGECFDDVLLTADVVGLVLGGS
ncbi:hypothetical protein ADL12_30260 [Streptomyces regalis]|uniref:Uncharacterized protein n=1 Tax=Streptomyces regalis TaxID=68262 RepID=A0A101JIC4_9ACTN|nr:hypothetical protein ADL12_30260 [Streptomyces regalis]